MLILWWVRERNLHLLTLSAKSEPALKDLVKSYQKYLSSPAPSASLKDICYTSSVGRSHFKYHLAIIAESIDELKQKLVGAFRAMRSGTPLKETVEGGGFPPEAPVSRSESFRTSGMPLCEAVSVIDGTAIANQDKKGIRD